MPTLLVAAAAEREGATDGVRWPTPCATAVCGICGEGAVGVLSFGVDIVVKVFAVSGIGMRA